MLLPRFARLTIVAVLATACSPAGDVSRAEPARPTAAPSSRPGASTTIRAARCARVAPDAPPLQRKGVAAARIRALLDPLSTATNISIAVALRGQILYARAASEQRTPASNQKLLLAMALLDRVGPRFRIPTAIVSEEPSRAGIVEGDLWIVGHGDPTLADTPALSGRGLTTIGSLARRIADSGVRHIKGSIVADTTYFSNDFDAPGWQPYVYGRYVQRPTALALNGNTASEPATSVARSLTEHLAPLGVRVEGRPRAGRAPEGLARIATVHSPPLTSLLGSMLTTSSNFQAEMLGKLLGAKSHGPPGTIASGARAITSWARRHGVSVLANDSSGLSYSNRITARGIITLLSVAERRPWWPALRRALPAPGEGTLGRRLSGVSVRAKTGSLFDGTSVLAGWVAEPKHGQWLAFSIMSREGSAAVGEQDRLVRALSTVALPRRRREKRSRKREGGVCDRCRPASRAAPWCPPPSS